MSDIFNTHVSVEDDYLTIKIPTDFVLATVVCNPESSVVSADESEYFPEHSVMRDFDKFLPELVQYIVSEDEVGWSLVNDLIFKAAEEAMEQGADGIEYK